MSALHLMKREITHAITAIRIRTAAHQLAAQIETLDGLTPEQRCDLRMLPCDMLGWADALCPDVELGGGA